MRCEPHTALDRLEALLEPHLGRYQRRAVDAMDVVREFVEERRADLLAEIEGGMPIWTKKPEPPFAMPVSFWSADHKDRFVADEELGVLVVAIALHADRRTDQHGVHRDRNRQEVRSPTFWRRDP